MKKIIIITACMLLAGCANTNFRMSLVDLDMREPAQIEASETEAEIIYAEQDILEAVNNEDVISTQTLPTDVWTAIMDALKVIKIRIRVFSIDYSNKGDK